MNFSEYLQSHLVEFFNAAPTELNLKLPDLEAIAVELNNRGIFTTVDKSQYTPEIVVNFEKKAVGIIDAKGKLYINNPKLKDFKNNVQKILCDILG